MTDNVIYILHAGASHPSFHSIWVNSFTMSMANMVQLVLELKLATGLEPIKVWRQTE